MRTMMKKATLAIALGATALVASAPADAPAAQFLRQCGGVDDHPMTSPHTLPPRACGSQGGQGCGQRDPDVDSGVVRPPALPAAVLGRLALWRTRRSWRRSVTGTASRRRKAMSRTSTAVTS